MVQIICFTLAFLVIVLFTTADGKHDRIKLKDIETLTLHRGRKTTGRRTSPISQIECVGGSAYCKFIPNTIQCYNRGFDGRSVNWECKAELSNKYEFGNVDVICEGYDYPDDDYVLVGSCGLEFTLNLVDGNDRFDQTGSKQRTSYKSSDSLNFGFVLLVLGLVFVIYFMCIRNTPRTAPTAPPPPAGFRSDFFGSDDSHSWSDHRGSSNYDYPNGRRSNKSSSYSGFLPGFMTGSTLGYLFGRGNRSNSSTSTFRNSDSNSNRRENSTTRVASGFAETKRR